MEEEILLCSNCFCDEGLRLDSFKIGIELEKACPNCKEVNGKKLNKSLIEILSHRFFVRGTLHKSPYGAAPLIQFNEHQKTSVNFSEQLKNDVKLIERGIGVGFFHYGPRMWMIGEVEPLKDLQEISKRNSIIKKIISDYPKKKLEKTEIFYRLRKSPKSSNNHGEYDSAPTSGNGRLDSLDLAILYGSQDIEVCIHECRVTVVMFQS